MARLKALERSEQIADALLAPIDDASLSPTARQVAAVRLLDAVLPLSETTVEVDLLADPESMSWPDMQRLAAQLVREDSAGTEIEEIPTSEA